MIYLLEFAKFWSIAKSNNDEINQMMDKEFENNERLIFDVYLEKFDKNIFLAWNNKKNHDIIEKIQSRTTFKNTHNFNLVIKDGINYLFNNHLNEIDSTGRYALHFLENNFYLLIDINHENLFSKWTKFFISTITISTPNNVYKTIKINEDEF